MHPKKLTLNGFKSFRNENVFIFPSTPGLYFLSGRNEVDIYLGSNGAGKSTIWDGLCWVLFGKTVRGIRAGDIANWGSEKGFYGIFEWENADNTYTLLRSWKPNKLLLTINNDDPIDVVQEDVDSTFGLTYDSFLFSILMGQSRPMFLDLRSSEQSQLFSEVFMLNRWLEYSDKASKETKELKDDLVVIEKSISALNAALDRMCGEHASIEKQMLAWKKDNKYKKQELLNSIDTLSRLINKIKSDILVLNYESSLLDSEKTELSACIEKLKSEIKEIENSLIDLNKRIIEFGSTLKAYKNDADNLYEHSKSDFKCNCCMQPVSREYALSAVRKIEKSIKRVESDLKKTQKLKRSKDSEFKNVSRNKLDFESDYSVVVDELQHVKSDIRFKQGQLKAVHGEKSRYEKESDVLHAKSNPFNESLESLEYEIGVTKQHLGTANRASAFISEKAKQTEFWVKGFKEIRLFVISEFLAQLEAEVNNALIKLGLSGWMINFSVEKETKSKTIKKGFHVLIKSPHNKNLVPWESWSGGESQRLRLAGNMGLSNLILSQYGVMSDIEIWDEPSTHLGKEGVNDLLELLRDRALLNNKQIWIVEHNALDFGDFAGSALVIKNENGSYIEQ